MAITTEHELQTARLAGCVGKDPQRLGGEPVFRGTRVPVKSLFDHLKAGETVELFLDDFPGVTKEQVRAVLDAAEVRILEDARRNRR